MHPRDETSPFKSRFLSDAYFGHLHKKFVEAFSDYLVSFELTERQFRNHIILNAVDLARSVGVFDGEEIVGFTLNGFGDWEGRPTVYDAGTGVIPSHRRRGLSRDMFEMMIGHFVGQKIEQYLLEVITENTPAVKLYKKLGFRINRELLLFENPAGINPSKSVPPGLSVLEMPLPKRAVLAKFWDGNTSWQNSFEAVERSLKMKRLLCAFLDANCVGYVVYSAGVGRVAQLAVHRDYRRQGIATALLEEMRKDTPAEFGLQVINVDSSMTDVLRFFENRGFGRKLAQFEMIKDL